MSLYQEKILVVDDDPGLLKLLVDTLNSIGYKVDGVSSGEKALSALEKIDYQLVITDVIMPGLDGNALLEIIRGKYEDLPVFFISGGNEPEFSSDFQPDGFIAKPFRIHKIEQLIENFLNRNPKDNNN